MRSEHESTKDRDSDNEKGKSKRCDCLGLKKKHNTDYHLQVVLARDNVTAGISRNKCQLFYSAHAFYHLNHLSCDAVLFKFACILNSNYTDFYFASACRWMGQILSPLHQERFWQMGADSAAQAWQVSSCGPSHQTQGGCKTSSYWFSHAQLVLSWPGRKRACRCNVWGRVPLMCGEPSENLACCCQHHALPAARGVGLFYVFRLHCEG